MATALEPVGVSLTDVDEVAAVLTALGTFLELVDADLVDELLESDVFGEDEAVALLELAKTAARLLDRET